MSLKDCVLARSHNGTINLPLGMYVETTAINYGADKVHSPKELGALIGDSIAKSLTLEDVNYFNSMVEKYHEIWGSQGH